MRRELARTPRGPISGGDPFLISEELAQLASAVWVSLTVVPIGPDLASQEEPVSNALPATLRD